MDYVKLETAVGTVAVSFIGNNECHVIANSASPSYSSEGGTDVFYRGKHWYVSIHLHRENDWGESLDTAFHHQFTVVDDYSNYTVPKTYRTKIVEAIREAIRGYVRENPLVPLQAEVDSAGELVNRTTQKAVEAEKEYRKALAAMAAASREYQRAYDALDEWKRGNK